MAHGLRNSSDVVIKPTKLEQENESLTIKFLPEKQNFSFLDTAKTQVPF